MATSFTPLSSKQEQISSEDIRSELAKLLRENVPKSCFVQLNDMKPFAKEPKVLCPPPPIEIAQSLENCEELLDKMRNITSSERENIQKATVGQAKCDEWKKQRTGRLTASKYKRIFTRMETTKKKPNENVDKLIAEVMHYSESPPTNSMKHGINLEPHAKKYYIKLRKKTHKCFVADESGLVIDMDIPYLAVSPDLLVKCNCCGEGLCEIKCPSSIAQQKPTAENYPHLVIQNGKTTLKRHSEYYFQVQGQMAVCRRNYVDFFVYTDIVHEDGTKWSYFKERICFDGEFGRN